jgi:hypothetical protein
MAKSMSFSGFIVTNFRKKFDFQNSSGIRDFFLPITRFFYWHQGFLFPIIWYLQFGEIFSKEEKLFEFTIEKKISKDFFIFLAGNK